MTYPALELLVQGYLTIDWPDDYADGWAAVDDYLTSDPNRIARSLFETGGFRPQLHPRS